MNHPTTIDLPPAGPALRLHQAAAELRRRAERARAEMAGNDYWAMGWRDGVENALGGTTGQLAALITPDIANGLANWLDSVAQEAVRHAAQGWGNCESEITDGWPETLAAWILREVAP